MIPVSAYRYLAEERKAAKTAKAQAKNSGQRTAAEGSDDQVVRLRAKP